MSNPAEAKPKSDAAKKMKYRLELRKVWATDSEKFYSAVVRFIESDCRIALVREGNTVYFNRKFSLLNQARVKAFAYGLAAANYDVE